MAKTSSPKPTKQSAKSLRQQKRHRRQWITFLRMCRYGINNFTRNAWLTIAATAVMTITLFVVFVTVVAQNVLLDTVAQLRNEVKISIYLSTETSPEDAERVVAEVRKQSSVLDVETRSPSEARDGFIQEYKSDPSALEAVTEASNQFPWTLSVKVQDINNTSQLATLIEENDTVKEFIDKNREPSFAGERRNAIETIGNAAGFAQQVGIIASVVFVAISMLIIFNTIRMAIFNRREEIQMMKLIGAERSFIRGPFLVEAIVYGFFAALIATGLGFGLLIVATPSLLEAQINVQPTIDMLTLYAGFVLLSMIVIGAIIGVISSSLATRRYLKL